MYQGGIFGLIRVKPESKTTCMNSERCEEFFGSSCICVIPSIPPITLTKERRLGARLAVGSLRTGVKQLLVGGNW